MKNMNKKTNTMKKRFTMLLASLLLCMGTVWAQNYLVREAVTALTDGTYVLVAMSDKGSGPCYYDGTLDRKYRYDINKAVQAGDYISESK